MRADEYGQGGWRWAVQAADAQRDPKRLADTSLAIDGTLHHVGQAKLAGARHRYRSAVLIGERIPRPVSGR